jgi:hypothetical protein
MGSSGATGSPAVRSGCEIKIATVGARLTQIEKVGLPKAVTKSLSEATRRVLGPSPLPTAWVDVTVLHDIIVALEKVAKWTSCAR